MSDQINAKGSATFKPHAEGQYIGVCVDTIDLGDKVETYQGNPPKLSHKCVLVFRTGERNESTGDYTDVSKEFTVSMGEKASLRKFLEQWRGKPYTTEQVEAGVPLHKLTGQPALLTIAHNKSSQGKTYANIAACVGVPKQMQGGVGKYPDYVRDEFWEKRKKEYADAAWKFKAEQQPETPEEEFDDMEFANANDLPF